MSDDGVPTGAMRRLLTRMNARDVTFDANTVERLLDGRLPVDDAPPNAHAVARVVELVGAGPTERELSNQSEAVAVLTAAIRRSSVDAPTPRRTSMSKQRITQLAAASTVGVMTLFGGLAAANALPGAAQSVASDVLGKVGVSVPSPDEHAETHPDGRGQSGSQTSGDSSSSTSSSKGGDISDLARNTPATGVDKGAAISSEASNGASQAGADHGRAGTTTPEASVPGSTPVSAPPFVTPPVSAPPVVGPPDSTPPVPAPPVSTPPVPTGHDAADGGLARKP